MLYVIKQPLVTEKNSALGERGVYVFEVSMSATKTEIAKAVASSFSVKVAKVRTQICRSRARRSQIGGKPVQSPKQVWKKALVTLKPGEKINIFEGA